MYLILWESSQRVDCYIYIYIYIRNNVSVSKFPILEGIGPVRMLLFMSSSTKLGSFPISGGMKPESLCEF